MKVKIPFIIAIVGAAIGYFVLSPFAMYISHITHMDMPTQEGSVWEVFTSEFLLWSASFAIFGLAIGVLVGLLYQRVRERTEEIKKEKEYKELIVNSIGEGLLTIDRDYRIVSANGPVLETSGLSLEEVIGKHCYEVTHGEDKPCSTKEHLCPLREVIETGMPSTAVHTHFDKDGNEIFVELAAFPVMDKEGNIMEIIELSRDSTERIEAQEALQNAEERLRSIVESTDDAIVVQDLEGKYLYFNAPPIYGVTKEEVVGKKPSDILKPEKAAGVIERINKIAESGESLVGDEESSLEGLELWFHYQMSPIKDSEGRITAITTVLRNITELKGVERGLKRNVKELEGANKMKDLFTDILSHDLLGPAGAIRNTTDLLLDNAREEDMELLEIIDWGAKKQIEIIELTGKLSKLESAQEMEKHPIDLKDVIARAVEDTRLLFEEADMAVENNLTREVQVNANPVIVEGFLNLLTNAERYAAGGKKVVIEAIEEEESHTVMVKDFGPGIPDKNKQSIFERFTRRRKESVRGTGLGLAIAKRVVEIHGGRIWVEDNPDGGSIFKVSLPK